ncbi:MAG: RluA family pseudouridine synthase [Candidatus Omnitrophica bacterium]|nr:RluA family pseudouridine synthase [Candidatus Omnitrophota bacterium]
MRTPPPDPAPAGKVVRHTVPPDAAPERLDRYLTRVIPGTTRSALKRHIEEGRVRMGRRPLKASHPVSAGEEYTVEIPPVALPELKPEKIPLEIIHEDDRLIVIDKPAGMVVHPGAGHTGGTLVNALLAHANKLSRRGGAERLGLVHRLDKDTSGILVVAKDDHTHQLLADQFAGRTVSRVYLAVVRGVVRKNEGIVEAPIGRSPQDRKRMTVRWDQGRESVTRYKVLERFKDATLLELRPETGRMHQLRVHLAHLGHPLLGDSQYGVRGGFSRQALHAHRLGFRHPGAEQWVEFVSPLPPDLKRQIERLRSA